MTNIQIILTKILNIVLSVIILFLGLRFIFMLLGANSSTPIVAWVYAVSGNFIYPFRGIFGNFSIGENGRIDVEAIIAMIAYTIIVYVVTAIINSSVRSFMIHHEGYREEVHTHA